MFNTLVFVVANYNLVIVKYIYIYLLLIKVRILFFCKNYDISDIYQNNNYYGLHIPNKNDQLLKYNIMINKIQKLLHDDFFFFFQFQPVLN